MVADLISEQRQWDLISLQANFSQADVDRILSIPLSLFPHDDVLIWSHSFTATSPYCTICNSADESITHALFSCPRAKTVWDLSPLNIDFNTMRQSASADILLHLSTVLTTSEFEQFLVICWCNWHERNAIYHGNTVRSPQAVAAYAPSYLTEFQSARAKRSQPTTSSLRILNITPLKPTTRVFYQPIKYRNFHSPVSSGTPPKAHLDSGKSHRTSKSLVSFNARITKHGRNGDIREAESVFFARMFDKAKKLYFETPTELRDPACGSLSKYEEGIQMHGLVSRMGLEFEVFLGNSIITMYCRFGCIDAASKMFHMMTNRDVVSWNSLIGGYVQCSEMEKAFEVFEKMPKKDVVSWTTMISGFFSEGLTEKAVQLFGMMPIKDTVSWTAIISGFVNNEGYEEAFRWFTEMLGNAIKLTPITLSCMLSASAGLATLNQGLQIHALVIKMNMDFDLRIQNSLVSMYMKCGSFPDAWQVFMNIDSPNTVSFNSMISGLAQNGLAKEALNLFSKMQNKGCKPNQVTFLGVLSACVHVGLVEDGWKYFKLMKSLYNIEAVADHYACMVDLLGRAGLIDEAMELIHSMPFEPHPGVWGALLGASMTHLRLDLAEVAAQRLIELEPDNATPYVVMSNLCFVSGKKDGEQLRMSKRLKRIKKSPGCSWIMVKDKVHLFLAGDQSHMEIEHIKAVLSMIMIDMRQLHFHG
ncbi:hypothetical protein G4B88_015276 [Cannabis sativa]|uniref:Pentatricopeptide repeat-containing protein n=1 Tax=Cannabis sativa TaxID=3483 RepID=A0A7J6E4L9_CANSA|nr:hypothetical protein G4B88_015276 [Cannabis sativa]